MRRVLSMFAMSFAALALIFSCDKTGPENEDPGKTPEGNPVENVSGTYGGSLNISLSLSGTPAIPVASDLANSIEISASETADGTVDITVKDLTVSVMGLELPFGDRTFEGCSVTAADDAYSISGKSEMSAEVPGVFAEPVQCDVDVQGTVKDGALTLNLTVAVASLPETVNPVETDVVGTYSGLLNVTMSGNPIVTDVEKSIRIELAENSEDAVNLVVENLTLNIGGTLNLDLGTIVVKDCAVTTSESTYTFKSESQKITVDNPLVGECDVEAEGTVTDGKISTELTITWNKMPIVVTFEGEAAAE